MPDSPGVDELFAWISECEKHNPFIRILRWSRRWKNPMLQWMWLSLAVHLSISLLLVLQSSLQSRSRGAGEYRLRSAASLALAGLRERLPADLRSAGDPDSDLESKIAPNLENLQISGEILQESDLSDLFSQMLSSYLESGSLEKAGRESIGAVPEDFNDYLNRAAEWTLNSGTKVFTFPQVPGQSGPQLKAVSDGILKRLAYANRDELIKTDYLYLHGEEMVRVNTHRGIKFLPADLFYRDCPYEKLVAGGADLFYAVTGFPFFREQEAAETGDPPDPRISPPKQTDGRFQVFITDRLPSRAGGPARIPLSNRKKFLASEAAIQKILDELMMFPDLKQLETLERDYLDRYDHESEDLIALTDRFIRNNLTNVFVLVSEVSAAFDFVEEVYFNKPLDAFYLKLWRSSPSSRIGVAFLLCLASHYDVERRALEHLFNAYDDAEAFLERKVVTAEIHDKGAKCFVIKTIYRDLMHILSELGYKSRMDVLVRYMDEEEKIYTCLAQMEGYAGEIGLYALGNLYWSREEHQKALQYWNQIDPKAAQNRILQEIRDVLRRTEDPSLTVRQIDAVLDLHNRKGTEQLLERLVRFKHWGTRYSD